MNLELGPAQSDRFHSGGFLEVDRMVDGAAADRAVSRCEALFRGEFEKGQVIR